MYKLKIDQKLKIATVVEKQVGNVLYSIPFDPANVDFQNFKKEVLAGAELQDADGNVMTQEQANQFVASLP
jgi:hypothetical protein